MKEINLKAMIHHSIMINIYFYISFTLNINQSFLALILGKNHLFAANLPFFYSLITSLSFSFFFDCENIENIQIIRVK